jgi:outer membrane protein OmpA-like peptidoglycan-associated protein
MRSKLIFLAPFAFVGCYKATGPEICTPVVTSWGSPVYHCVATPMAVPEMPPVVEKPVEAPPQPRTEVTNEEIKLREKVEFETDSAKLLPSSTPLLDEVVTVMKEHPEIEHVRVGGHTDSTGDKAHNVKLSDDRAASVKQYLVDHGIAPERLASKGYGETRPIADNNTEEGRAQNRRVDIHILRHKGEKKDKEDK